MYQKDLAYMGSSPAGLSFPSHWHTFLYFILVISSCNIHIIVLALQSLFLKFSWHFPGQGTGNCQRKIQSLKRKQWNIPSGITGLKKTSDFTFKEEGRLL